MRTDADRQTDIHTETNSRFLQFREHVEKPLDPSFCVIYNLNASLA